MLAHVRAEFRPVGRCRQCHVPPAHDSADCPFMYKRTYCGRVSAAGTVGALQVSALAFSSRVGGAVGGWRSDGGGAIDVMAVVLLLMGSCELCRCWCRKAFFLLTWQQRFVLSFLGACRCLSARQRHGQLRSTGIPDNTFLPSSNLSCVGASCRLSVP